MDLFEPSGHGRRRRRDVNAGKDSSKGNTTIQSAKFHENIEYTVLMPGGECKIIYLFVLTGGKKKFSRLQYTTLMIISESDFRRKH